MRLLGMGAVALLLSFSCVALAQRGAPVPTAPPVLLPAPPPPVYQPQNQDVEAGLKAAALWSRGSAADVAAAYDKAGFVFPKAGAWREGDRRFLSDWVAALTWAAPPLAARKLAEWEQADPQDALSQWGARRTVLATRIHLEQGQIEQARLAVDAYRAKLRAATSAAEASEKLRENRERSDTIWREIVRLKQVGKTLQRAAFLIDARVKGEVAFADYADAAANPFVDGSGSVFVTGIESVACASHDLKPDDWAILDVSLLRNPVATNSVHVRPFAASRFAAAKPFLEQSANWGITVKNGTGDDARKALLVRCTRNPKPPGVGVPDTAYLFEMLKPLSPKLPEGYRFDMFRQEPSDLARDKQWVWLMNLAYRPEANVPELQERAQKALLDGLAAMEKPDPVAIAIVEHLMLRDAEAGKLRQVKYWLPGRVAFVERMRAQALLPPRILSHFELLLAQRYESNAEPLAATSLYRGIVARDHKDKEALVPEQIKAQLRLAAIAEAAGQKSESARIFGEIGLSPDQCSIYQQRPPMLDFRHPDYSGAMLREEAEGRLQFEFDLDKGGLPSNLRVTVASPPFLFDAKTLDSFKRARFAPITNGGDAFACKGAEQSFVWRMPD